MIRHWVRNHVIKKYPCSKNTFLFIVSSTSTLTSCPQIKCQSFLSPISRVSPSPKSSVSHQEIKNLKQLLYKHAIEYFHFQNSSFILWRQSFGCSLKSRWHIPPCDLPSELQMGEMEREPMWSTQINTSTYNQAVCPFSVQHLNVKTFTSYLRPSIFTPLTQKRQELGRILSHIHVLLDTTSHLPHGKIVSVSIHNSCGSMIVACFLRLSKLEISNERFSFSFL